MTGKWVALAVAVFALLAVADADFHQEDSEMTLTTEEQEEITNDWFGDDEDRRGRRVIKAQIAIRLKGRKWKPKNETGDMSEGGSQTVHKKPRIILADVLVRLRKPKRPQELDYDDEVTILSHLVRMLSSRNRGQAEEYGEGSHDFVQNDLELEKLFEEDEEGKGGKGKGGPVIRAEVAIRLKGRKNKTDHDEEDGELNNMISLGDSESGKKARNLIRADVVVLLRKPRNLQELDSNQPAGMRGPRNRRQADDKSQEYDGNSGEMSTDSGEMGSAGDSMGSGGYSMGSDEGGSGGYSMGSDEGGSGV